MSFNLDSMSDADLDNLISKSKFVQYNRFRKQILVKVAAGEITQEDIMFVRHWPGNMDDLILRVSERMNVSCRFADVFVDMVYQDEVK